MPDEIEQVTEESIQSRSRGKDPSTIGYSVLHWFAQAGETLAPWWSTKRDAMLREFAKESDHWAGAMSTMSGKIAAIPFHIEPRDLSIKAWMKQADEYERRLYELSEFGDGYDSLIAKTLQAFGQQDNGFFWEIIGDGKKDGPITGPALGLAVLDSSRCVRTGDPEFPVIYRDAAGQRYRLHRTRVAFRASMPSDREEMHGIGFCPLSRAANTCQHLIDIATYEQEKLGSRPRRGILLTGGGLGPQHLQSAIRLADSTMDAKSLSRYGEMVALGSPTTPDATITLIDLAGVPDGFDKQLSITLGMYAIALAWNIPPRWLWPATATGATKADAMFSHIAGQGAGVGAILTMFTLLLGGSPLGQKHLTGKFLPPHLKIVYDFQDDEQDRMVAEIREKRANRRKVDLETGVIDTRTARQQAMDSGDITEQQYNSLELEDGRLPDGRDVLTLFSSTDDFYLRLLDVGVPNPLALDINDPFTMLVEIDATALDAQDVLVTATNAKQKLQAEQAIAALGKLKEAYSEIVTQQLQAQVTEELTGEEAQSQEEPEQETEQEQLGQPEQEPEQEQDEQPESEQEEKGFNFGARMGEVIGGNLARGAGGRFVSADQIRSGMLSALLERLRGKREGGDLSAAEQKRLENRQAVIDKLSGRLAAGTISGLASLRNGDTPDNVSLLVGRGFAKRNPDGTINMTARGRKLMNAANAGDVDRATEALQAKPARGGGGGGGKTDEQREQERLQEIADNRSKVANTLDEDLAADFDALGAFFDGADIDTATGERLAQAGLIEYDPEGQPRLTAAGRRAMRAASRGDTRAAQDAISVARERAAKIEDAITGLDDQIEAIEMQFADLDAIGATMDPDDAERLRERLAQLRERREEQASKLRAKALFTKQGDDEPPDRSTLEDDLEAAIQPILRRYRREAARAIKQGERPDTEGMRDDIIDALIPILILAALSALNHYEEQFQLYLSDEDTLEQVTQWANQHAEREASRIMQTTDGLLSESAQVIDDTERSREIAQQAFTDERAQRIGITEITMALAAGALLYQAIVRTRHNVEIELLWFTQEDERVCPVCAPLHATTQEVWSQQFPSGPPAHVRCRCGITARRKR